MSSLDDGVAVDYVKDLDTAILILLFGSKRLTMLPKLLVYILKTSCSNIIKYDLRHLSCFEFLPALAQIQLLFLITAQVHGFYVPANQTTLHHQ